MFLQIPGFSAGELSPQLQGRQDLQALKLGCRKLRNMLPARLGNILQRPGFMKRAYTDSQADLIRVALLPFVASASEAYIVEAGPGYFRFFQNGSILITNADNITGAGVVSALGQPLKIATPYAAGDLFELQWAHANDVQWFAHRDYPVYKLTRFLSDGFSFEPMAFLWPPLRDLNAAEITLTATATPPDTVQTVGATVDLLATGGDVFTADNVGGYFGIDHRRETPFAEYDLSKGSGTAAANLVITAQPTAGETFTIGKDDGVRVYTWDGEGPYGVPIGSSEDDSLSKAAIAINGDTGANPGTIAHPQVEAENLGAFTTGVKASGILTFTDNDLTAGTPDQFSIDGTDWEFTLDCTTGPANRVQVGATLVDSIANAILAINGTGAPGVNYTIGTAASATTTADAAAIGNTLRVTANTAGSAGNAIATEVDHTSRMSWGSSTLTGGADASTWKMQVKARIEGAAGNDIAVAETMAAGAWQPTGFLTGGADNTNYDPSNLSASIPTVRVNGTWEVYTLGRWYGTLTLQQQRTTGEWEAVRAWTSQNDNNVDATGIVDGEKTMRLIFVGAGIQDDLAPARATLTAIDAIVHGLVLITSVTDSTHAQGAIVKPIWSSDPTYLWAEGSFSDRRGYASAVVLHQQRLVFGQGSRIIGSQTGGFDNFLIGEIADDSYQYELAATVAQNIVVLQSQEGLLIQTETNEWLADGGSNGAAITPQAFRGRQLTEYGSAYARSIMVHSNVVFIQAGLLIANEYLFDFGQQNYEAVDLGELADHLTRERLLQLAWAPAPNSILYFVTYDGSLLSLAYRRNAGNANEGGMLAWAKNVTADASESGDGMFESVCVVPGSNELSEVWCVIRRELPDGSFVRTIESFEVDHWSNLQSNTAGSIADLCLTDGAVKKTAFLPIDPIVTGLGHLEGMTVSVLLNGVIHPQRVVTGGQITLDMTGIEDASTAIVGLPVIAELQPWFATPNMRDGGSDGRSFRVGKLNTRFYLTGAATFRDDEDSQIYDVSFRTAADVMDQPVPLFTGLKKLQLAGGWRDETQFAFINTQPLPMNISGVTAQLEVSSERG